MNIWTKTKLILKISIRCIFLFYWRLNSTPNKLNGSSSNYKSQDQTDRVNNNFISDKQTIRSYSLSDLKFSLNPSSTLNEPISNNSDVDYHYQSDKFSIK